MDALRHYCEVWAVDFEFAAPLGERPTPLCVVARELRSGRIVQQWLAEGDALEAPPYPTGPEALFVAYYASAELGCHIALDWPMPARILDLYAEFRCLTSGLVVPCGRGLLGALAYFGLPALAAAEKESLRQLAIRGGPYTDTERTSLIDYCQSDVDALVRLLPAMLPDIDLPRALLRGRYMAAASRMEWGGVPLDVTALDRLRGGWDGIKGRLIDTLDPAREIYVPAGIDPATPCGSAVLSTAAEWGVVPHQLADAVGYLWEQDRAGTTDRAAAIRAARRETGLTVRQVSLWEDAGRDYSTFPGLDVKARELAREYPHLGIGPGYVADESADHDPDYAGLLWDKLREPDPTAGRKYNRERLRRAAELLSGTPDAARSGGPRSFSATHFADFLARRGIPWPRLDSGALALDDDTFREMARAYPEAVGPVRELRHALGQLRLSELAVGRDGRNRCLLSVFGSRTGRNQPSNSRFIFGPSTWLRSLIRPEAGRAVAYLDWSQQELAIAAGLSGDPAMQEAYTSGDFYLTFAKLAGAVPADATKATHGPERDQFKTVALGVLYGLSADGLARKLGVPPCRGRQLLRLHQQTFRRFWDWSQAQLDLAMLTGELRTVFGWTVHVGPDANPRSLINFPMQANGAEMMRLAACLATERGIGVCAPVHDAFLIEAAADEIEADAARMQEAMREASELVLPRFPLRSEAKIVRHPDRYADPRGERFWDLVWGLLDGEGTCSAGATGVEAPALPPPPLILSLPM
jgi:hypothetical protein